MATLVLVMTLKVHSVFLLPAPRVLLRKKRLRRPGTVLSLRQLLIVLVLLNH